MRLQHTCQLLSTPTPLSLADIAAQLQYTDQSHMSRDIKRLTGFTARQLAARQQMLAHPLDVAFLQD